MHGSTDGSLCMKVLMDHVYECTDGSLCMEVLMDHHVWKY